MRSRLSEFPYGRRDGLGLVGLYAHAHPVGPVDGDPHVGWAGPRLAPLRDGEQQRGEGEGVADDELEYVDGGAEVTFGRRARLRLAGGRGEPVVVREPVLQVDQGIDVRLG